MRALRSIWRWVDDRTGLSAAIGPLAQHLVPPNTGWWYVFGSATLFVFILQVIGGITLATAYVTSTNSAYQSLQFISNQAFLGRIVRGMHFFGASAMVVLIGAHMIRTFLFGSYKFPREVNWLTGSLLFLLTLGMAFTGQLLRWDQNAVWGVIVGAEQAGRVPIVGDWLARFILAGDTVGGATLSRFFSFHVFFIPALIFGFLGFHLYLVIRNGISEPPVAGEPVDPKTYRQHYEDLLKRSGEPFWPNAAWRDVVFAAAVFVVIFLLAWIVGPPQLGKPPDPTIIQAYPRPDWEFLWYFGVLALLPTSLETWVIVGAPLLLGVVLFLLPFLANRGERSPRRRPWAVGFIVGVVVMVGVLWRLGSLAPWSPNFEAPPLSPQIVNSTDPLVVHGAQLFNQHGCEYCHLISGEGGRRGPDLTTVARRLSADEITTRILNGGTNMPAFAAILTPQDLDAIRAFLLTRK
jgi:ubiquinol-cytochrome c reductase cytochrome b subunit